MIKIHTVTNTGDSSTVHYIGYTLREIYDRVRNSAIHRAAGMKTRSAVEMKSDILGMPYASITTTESTKAPVVTIFCTNDD